MINLHNLEEELQKIDIIVNGKRPWDIQIHDKRAFNRIIADGSLGLGETYMEGWWSCQAVDVFIYKLLYFKFNERIKSNIKLMLYYAVSKFLNKQTKKRSKKVVDLHYNLDNELFRLMLGETMSYTCAYWKDATTLDKAQANKHNLICRKIGLKPGDKILELGCGFGGFAKYAASHYGCEIVSVNISKSQLDYANEICKGLPVKFYLADYRDINLYNPNHIEFDKVVSIGMCEHVGHKNYKLFMDVVNQNLKKHGLFLLHTIGYNCLVESGEPWLDKYIFPNSLLPSIQGLGKAIDEHFVMEDWHNFGAYYDNTLLAWHDNFTQNWDMLKNRYDEKFFRMWTYYLLLCAATFRARKTELWQIVLSKDGLLGGYESHR